MKSEESRNTAWRFCVLCVLLCVCLAAASHFLRRSFIFADFGEAEIRSAGVAWGGGDAEPGNTAWNRCSAIVKFVIRFCFFEKALDIDRFCGTITYVTDKSHRYGPLAQLVRATGS